MESFWDSFLVRTIRWIAILPLAILYGLILIPKLIEFVPIWLSEWKFGLGHWNFGLAQSDFFQLYVSPLINVGASAVSFIYIGVSAAPNYKRVIGIILGLTLVIIYTLIVVGFIKYDLIWSSETSLGWYFILWCVVCVGSIFYGIEKAWEEY